MTATNRRTRAHCPSPRPVRPHLFGLLRRVPLFGIAASVLAWAACSDTPQVTSGKSDAAFGATPVRTLRDPEGPAMKTLDGQLQQRRAEAPPRDGRAKLRTGTGAPDFELKDAQGRRYRLADFKGKVLVLEFFNPECPQLRYAHEKGGLRVGHEQGMPEGGDQFTWVAVNSSKQGERGTTIEGNADAAKRWGLKHPVLFDEQGKAARDFGARSTPHIFIIDKEGKLAYSGAVDNAPMGVVAGQAQPVHHVRAALADLERGRPVAVRSTVPYGCGLQAAAAP